MNKKELLEECKRRYPVGTEVECAYVHSDKQTVKEYPIFTIDADGDVYFKYKGSPQIFVFYRNIWAKTISKSQSKQEQLEAEYGKVEKEQKQRAEKIAKIKADQEKKLHLSVIDGVLWILYGNDSLGYIDNFGRCCILDTDVYQKTWEQWSKNGMPVSHEVVERDGNHYKINEGFELINTDIDDGGIYDFEYCIPNQICDDENIQRYSNGTVKIF